MLAKRYTSQVKRLPPLNRRMFAFSLFVAYCLTCAFLVFSETYSNYAHTDGFVLPNGKVIGGDFITFYIAGKLLREEPARLYDFALQLAREKAFFAGTSGDPGILVFVYPPPVAYLFSLFSSLTLLQAYLSWYALSGLLALAAIVMTCRALGCGALKTSISIVAALGFVPFTMNCLGAGQTSCLGLLIVAGMLLSIIMGREFAAGLFLGLGFYKPPLFILLSVAMLALRKVRILAGAAVSALALLLWSVSLIGWDGFMQYVSTVSHYRYGQQLLPSVSLPVNKGVGLFRVIHSLGLPVSAANICWLVALVCAVAYLGLTGRHAATKTQKAVLFSLMSALSLLFSPQMIIYDLTICLVPVIAVAWALEDTKLLHSARATAIKNFFLMASLLLYCEWLLRDISESGYAPTTWIFHLWCLSILMVWSAAKRPAELDLGKKTH